jgi:hypothetical protein
LARIFRKIYQNERGYLERRNEEAFHAQDLARETR